MSWRRAPPARDLMSDRSAFLGCNVGGFVVRSKLLYSVIAVPLAFGTGLGIGSVGSANAATVSNDISAALQRITTAVMCATKQPCFSATNSATTGSAIAGTA